MSDIPEGPYYQFWVGVSKIGADNGGDEARGLDVLKWEVLAVLKRTIYAPGLDFERLFYKALESAVISYDPSKGSVSTHVIWKARDIAQRMVRSKREFTKWESVFTDIEDEEGNGPWDFTGVCDSYNVSSKLREMLSGLDYMHFKSIPKLSAHTYGELVALLSEGKNRTGIAEEWGVSTPSILACIREVQQFICDLGVQRELETATG